MTPMQPRAADASAEDAALTLITDALVVDGTGGEPVHADVLLRAGRIEAVRDLDHRPSPSAGALDAPGARRIDADGLALTPGFIDMHAHSDLAVLRDGEHLAKTLQGVTTEVIGQDGLAYAPLTEEIIEQLTAQIAGWNGLPEQLPWRSVGEYLDHIDALGTATNIAYLIPQGTLRMIAVGTEDRPAADHEIRRMQQMIEQGMREGAHGLSSGLTYVPGMFASTEEIIALCRTTGALCGYYSPHHRSYGAGALEAYAEMIEVARASGCPLHLTHATLNFPVNRGRAGELLEMVDAALEDGVDITLDTYPYLPGSTTLSALLPSSAQAGGVEATLARLADPLWRERITHELEVTGSDGCHGVVVDWESIEIAGVREESLREHVGRTVAQIAAGSGRAGAEVFLDLLVRDRLGTSILQHVGDEQNLQTIMRHRVHTGGSDGILEGGKPHPRGAGTFARYLGRYVRELGVLGLAEAIAHLCAAPARRLGLADRGRIAPGMVADLVLLDPATVADGATFEQPRRGPEGIERVMIGGRDVVVAGERTAVRAGRSLRGPAFRAG